MTRSAERSSAAPPGPALFDPVSVFTSWSPQRQRRAVARAEQVSLVRHPWGALPLLPSTRVVLVLAACGLLEPLGFRLRQPAWARARMFDVTLHALLSSRRTSPAELSFLASHALQRNRFGRDFVLHRSGAPWMCFSAAAADAARFTLLAGSVLREFAALLPADAPEVWALEWAADRFDVEAAPFRGVSSVVVSAPGLEVALLALSRLDPAAREVFGVLVADAPPSDPWTATVPALAELSVLSLS